MRPQLKRFYSHRRLLVMTKVQNITGLKLQVLSPSIHGDCLPDASKVGDPLL